MIFLDADDRLAPEAASTVAAAFAADPELASVQYRLRVIDGDGRSTGTDPAAPVGRAAVRRPRAACDPLPRYHWQPTTGNAYTGAALARILPLPEGTYRIEADAFLAELIPFCGPMRGLDDVLGDYRVHGANNYRGATADAAFFRRKIARIHEGHALVVERAPGLGLGPTCPRRRTWRSTRRSSASGWPRCASTRRTTRSAPTAGSKLGVRGAYRRDRQPPARQRRRPVRPGPRGCWAWPPHRAKVPGGSSAAGPPMSR